jgi:hypothetical protein
MAKAKSGEIGQCAGKQLNRCEGLIDHYSLTGPLEFIFKAIMNLFTKPTAPPSTLMDEYNTLVDGIDVAKPMMWVGQSFKNDGKQV